MECHHWRQRLQTYTYWLILQYKIQTVTILYANQMQKQNKPKIKTISCFIISRLNLISDASYVTFNGCKHIAITFSVAHTGDIIARSVWYIAIWICYAIRNIKLSLWSWFYVKFPVLILISMFFFFFQFCVSCCTESYCNEPAPSNHTGALRMSTISSAAISTQVHASAAVVPLVVFAVIFSTLFL